MSINTSSNDRHCSYKTVISVSKSTQVPHYFLKLINHLNTNPITLMQILKLGAIKGLNGNNETTADLGTSLGKGPPRYRNKCMKNHQNYGTETKHMIIINQRDSFRHEYVTKYTSKPLEMLHRDKTHDHYQSTRVSREGICD